MVVDKGLLLKGLGVCAVCAGGAATIHFKGREIKDFFSPYEAVGERKIEVAGLECVETEGGECSIKNGGKVFVKRGNDNHFELADLGKGKIKRYKDNGYEGGYKFLIEEGDIGSEENKKLEEFETYEIKKGGEGDAELKGKEYLFRKTNTKEEIKNSLGLGCEVPEANTTIDNCSITNNKVGSVTITGGTVTLSISKETDREDYPLGYRFTFKNSHTTENANLTVGGKTLALKNNSPMDFKIKKSGSSLALEKAWTLESLSRKVGIECGKDGYCSPKEGGEILVKRGSDAHFKVSSLGEGKIKVYEVEGEDYNENLKFSIEEKDIAVSGSNKLEEFESYEIKKGGSSDGDELNGKYYFSRKGDAKAGIKKALGLPNDNCNLPTNGDSQECTITGNNKVGSLTISGGTVTLNISKETDFPLGYKFTFKNTGDGDSTLTTVGKETVTLKKNSPVEFKIKKEGSSLSLEKAWTLEELAKKVGIKKDSEEGYWTVDSAGMNVKVDTTKKEKITKYADNQGKIKLHKDQANHNEGLKFTVEKGDLKLKEYVDGNTKEFYLGQFQSFEIVKDGDGKWYFTKKEEDEAKVKELLGLGCELPKGSETSKECTLTTENIKKIKFDGLGSGATASYTGTPKLTIHKESGKIDYPLDYRFNFSSAGDSDAVITIPSATPSSITLKKDLSIDYKIKRAEDVIFLEKAWTPESLMKGAVGFAGSKNNEWTEAGEYGISIKQGSNKTSSAKTNGSTGNSKVKVYEGVPGYNQGYKFMVEGGDMNLKDGDSVSKLTKYETYEVVKDGSDKQWYFSRKQKAEESIRELLGIPDKCEMPTDAQTPKECELDDSALKAIKFDGKGNKEVTTTGSGSMKLSISKVSGSETDYPLGFKFTFSSSNGASFTIPQGSSGSISVANGSNTEFKIKVGERSNLTLEKAK